ncbi:MAG: hypothetical protein AAF772_15595, partial [Acidobacteriota bacterium]
ADAEAVRAALAWFQAPAYAGSARDEPTMFLLWRAWDAHARGDPATARRRVAAADAMRARMGARGGDPAMAQMQQGIAALLRAQMADDALQRAAALAETERLWQRAAADNRWLMHQIPLWQGMAAAVRGAAAQPRPRPIG